MQKFTDNLAGIRTRKQIEADHRRATPDEQAFSDSLSGQFKDK